MSKYFLGGILIGIGLCIGCLGANVIFCVTLADFKSACVEPPLLFVLTSVLEVFGLFLPFLMRRRKCIVSLKLLPLSILAIQVPIILWIIYNLMMDYLRM